MNMAEGRWRVEQTKAGVQPVWRIYCEACGETSAPVLCLADETQAVAWAEKHHVTPLTTVNVSWKDCRPSAEWVPRVVSGCVLAGALRVPAVVGAETGFGFIGWATKIFGEIGTIGLPWLEQAIRAEFTISPFTFDGTDELMIEPLSAIKYRKAEIASEYTKYVAWRR